MIHVDTIERFILAEKPNWCKGMDVAVIVYLLAISDHSGISSPNQHDLAIHTGAGGVNFAGLRSSLDRLHFNGWIKHVKVKGFGARHTYQINFQNLPRKEEHVSQTP